MKAVSEPEDTVYIVQYTVYSIQYTETRRTQYAVYSIQYTVCSIQYAVYSIQYTETRRTQFTSYRFGEDTPSTQGKENKLKSRET